ncbi:MAG: cob(I)yrinic acid a,c-diamide adenosyltransferase [Candidatus Omnitrophota bacterium]
MKKRGLIQIYTGNGKGKTTAAIGLACRARGHGLKVCYVSFHKDPEKWGCGEHGALEKIGVDVYRFAKKHPYFDKNTDPGDIRRECLKGVKFIKKIFQEKKYDILILDEINISVREGFLEENEILGLLEKKPENLELILTGRNATKRMIEKADLVSGIKKIKHPYDSGVKGRKGIEY